MNSVLLIAVAFGAFIVSFFKSKDKSKKVLNLSFKLLKNTFTEVFFIMALVALFLSWVPESFIKTLLGNPNQIFSVIFGAGIGTITIIPAFVAFPLSGSLLKSGANLIAVASFLTTLTMVGFATMPLEIKYFGKKFTFIRNGVSTVVAILIALTMGVIL